MPASSSIEATPGRRPRHGGAPDPTSPSPDTAEQAVDICEAGGIAPTLAIAVRSVSGEKFDRIIDYQLGAIPPRLDGSDERDGGSLPMPDWPPDDCEVPF